MMRVLYVAVFAVVSLAPSAVLAQTLQVSPVRVEFTRPGGTPGSARGVIKPSEIYMMAAPQPGPLETRKRRKRR
jgi:hypothetical protein